MKYIPVLSNLKTGCHAEGCKEEAIGLILEGELLYRCPLHALDEIKSVMETYKNILVNFHDVLDANEIAGRIDELEQGFKKIKNEIHRNK